MAQTNFNTPAGSKVERKLLILYLNIGTAGSPIWRAVGKRVEDSSMEYDWGEEAKTDIYGETYATTRRPIISQTFEPCELDGGDAAQLRIWNRAIRAQDVAAIANNDLMVVHAYAGDPDTGVFAERYMSSMAKPAGLGGSSHIGMQLDVTFGGKRVTGTAAISSDGVVFTPGEGETIPDEPDEPDTPTVTQLSAPEIYLEEVS